MSASKKGSSGENSAPMSAKDKFEQWKSLSLSDRLDRVGSSVQKVKDAPYQSPDYKMDPKFDVNDPVAVCYQGLYYHAIIQKVEKPYFCEDLQKDVPLYIVKYPGWGTKSGQVTAEPVVEYDLIGTTKNTVAHELLYAHYWNKAKSANLRKKMKSMFELPPRTLERLETKWQVQLQQEDPTQTISFAQWIGMEPIPSSSSASSSSHPQ